MKKSDLSKLMSFGFEQTFTIEQWWSDEGFTATSDTPLKREKMLALAQAIAKELDGEYIESEDIWKHMQYETFDKDGNPSFVVTMDPGSIEVKTPPRLLDGLIEMATPLFKAAEVAGLVPYRNWWYGVKGATEGGCHVNMGGLSDETNPLIMRPDLAVKYAAYVHNRPWVHYPFMGPDTGPEGNAMRMDEKPGLDKVKDAFEKYKDAQNKANLTADEIHDLFKDTNLIAEKASYPSLFKLKNPLYLIEDRAQESLRGAEEFYHVSEMRIKIFEQLLDQDAPEDLKKFDDLHGGCLTSFWLWENFQVWANQIDLNPENFQCFFDRQFPVIEFGQTPQNISLKEGRRPRVVKDIQKRGNTVVSKTIDTSYKRVELFFDGPGELNVKASGIEFLSPPMKSGNKFYKYLDIKVDKEAPELDISLYNSDKKIKETAKFNLNDMKWV
ncbi:MAG: hypothetical protein CME64_13885 [Halobacteriovoraceae bacterium]|nr:hypothetical protein [Halobacteriovoraceae bacterium]